MQIDEREEQRENAWFSIRERAEGDSNVTVIMPNQSAKQLWQTNSRDEGRQSVESDEQPLNAWFSMRESLEGDSNVTFKSFEHPSKQ
jgi:hypothetical protein